MQKTEVAVIGIMLGAVPIIAGFLTGWWISIRLVPESRIFLCALVGLHMGLLIDIIFLRGWIHRAYSMKPSVWMGVYLFYSIGMFGFFMGVPVFNVLLALPAGIFVGGWGAHNGADATRMRKSAQRCAVFTTGVLALVCVASASIALASTSTASDLQRMLGLPFGVTPAMILGIILCGGAAILSLQWWLTIRCAEASYGCFIARANPSMPRPGHSGFMG